MWKQEKLEAQLETVRSVIDFVVVSGGLAWHLMSPPHEENEYMHDHKDVDLFVMPESFGGVVAILKNRGFNRYWTKYDGITPNFYRYGHTELQGEKRVKVLLDLFIEDVPFIEVEGFKVVEPSKLLSYYGGKHASSFCWAVKAATILVARGISPVNRPELIVEPESVP